jgi:hypothetical protein
VEDGVSLVGLTDVQGDAAFLEDSVRRWLDEEWISQPVHGDIARKVAELYISVSQTLERDP